MRSLICSVSKALEKTACMHSHTHKLTKCMLNHASLCCHMHLTMQPIIYCRLILVPYSVGTCTLPCFIVIKGKRLKTVVVCGTTEDKRAQRRRNIQ